MISRLTALEVAAQAVQGNLRSSIAATAGNGPPMHYETRTSAEVVADSLLFVAKRIYAEANGGAEW